MSLLSLARQYRWDDLIRALSRGEGDVHERDSQDGWTALHEAAKYGHQSAVESLLAKDADVNAKTQDGGTALHVAAANGHQSAVESLLAKDADVNAKNKGGWTALHFVAVYGHQSAVESLLAKDADVNAKATFGETALYVAAAFGRQSAVESLLAKDADVNAKNKDGWTALHEAATNGHQSAVESLLAKDADVNAKDTDGRTALHLAAANGLQSAVESLLAKDADVNAKNKDGRTALHSAAREGHQSAVESLLAKDADVNAKATDGWTALHDAALFGHQSAVESLLAKDADVNAKEMDGWTALHDAAREGHQSAVESLLAKGADVNAKNKDGDVPAALARDCGHTLLADSLDRTGSRQREQAEEARREAEELARGLAAAFFTSRAHVESMPPSAVAEALRALGVSEGGKARLRELVQGVDGESWDEVLRNATRRCIVEFLVGCGRSEGDAARAADARMQRYPTAQDAAGIWESLIAEYCPRGPCAPPRSAKLLVISPGFGIRSTPAQIRILERAYGAAVVRSSQHSNPNEAGFDMDAGILPLLREVEEHRPAAILCASKGGRYMMKLWSLLEAGGHDHLSGIAYLMINVPPDLETLPSGVKVTLVQGANEQVWPRARGYRPHGQCEPGSLEALIRTGSFGKCHLYYTADVNSHFGYRRGDTHNPASLLEYDCLPRLVDALFTDFPAFSFQASSRLFLSRQRREAEQRLGWHHDILASRFQGHALRVDVPSGSIEFRDVEAVFRAEPTEGVKRFYYRDLNVEHVAVTKIERVQNRHLKDRVDGHRGYIKEMLERMGAQYEAGVHCRWLFHGPGDADALQSIIENPMQGFAPQMGLANGRPQLWGYGAYFALHASYSVNAGFGRDCVDEEGNRMLLLCLVDTGVSCVGEGHLLSYPRMHPSNRSATYMSYMDSASNPEIFVALGDHAYPAYIIHYD